MAKKPVKTTTKPKGQQAIDTTVPLDPNNFVEQAGGIFIGIPSGSQAEARLTNLSHTAKLASRAKARGPFGAKIGFDAYKTGSELDALKGYAPDDIYLLQQRLYDAGMVDAFIPGKLDNATRKAFVELLGISNASGKSWQSTLDDIAAVGGIAGKDTTNKVPAIEVTSPDDLKAILKGVSQTLYGGNLPEDEANRFVQSFQQQQMAAGQAQNAASEAGTGAVYTGATSPDVAAEKQIRQDHPNEVFATALNQRLGLLGNALAGGQQPSGMSG